MPAGSEGLFFLPYLSGERTPHADPDARGCFVGLTLSHHARAPGPLDHGRRDLFDARQPGDHRGAWACRSGRFAPPAAARAARLWRQIQADVFGRKVVTINSEEGPAYGVALLAAVGAGAFKNIEEACAATIRVVSKPRPTGRRQELYDRAFPIYQQLYRSLKDDFKSIAALA